MSEGKTKRESARGQPGRNRVVISAHPRAPARLRVGGLEWRRLFGSRRLGDPAHGSEARQLGQAQKHVRGNGLSCGRYGGRPSGNRIGCRLLEAHVDERMTSALEALDPADPTIGMIISHDGASARPRGRDWRAANLFSALGWALGTVIK